VSTAAFRRALDAEPQLQALDLMVNALVALAPTKASGRPMCHACIWEMILKPLVSPWVGWERGYLPDQAEEPRPEGEQLRGRSLAELLAIPDVRAEATTQTEQWLRTSEAFDVVTAVWLHRLEAADPGTGHGLPKAG
jgi:hypothetical protein